MQIKDTKAGKRLFDLKIRRSWWPSRAQIQASNQENADF